MKVEDIRSEFTVGLLHESSEVGRALQAGVTEHGFPCRWYRNVSELLTHVPLEPPHFIILDVGTCRTAFADICHRLKAISSEIQILALSAPDQMASVLEVGRGVDIVDIFAMPLVHISQLQRSLDRLAVELYYLFENEQLITELRDLQKSAPIEPTARTETVTAVEIEIPAPASVAELTTFVTQFQETCLRMEKAEDPQTLNDIFMAKVSEVLGDRPVLFFKFLPAYSSLLAAQARGMPAEQIRGIGVNLSSVEPLILQELLQSPEQMPQLHELLRDGFGCSSFRALSVEILGETLGVFVFFSDIDIRQTALVTVWDMYRLYCRDKILVKRNHSLDLRDPLTDLVNRKSFNEILDNELARSRRIYLPTSLIALDIDAFAHYNSVSGQINGNLVLKSVAKLMRKTSRAQDILVRYEDDYFCILLPHTDARGAAVKAERLRRMIENMEFPLRERQPNGRLTVSLGISEYPSLAADAEGLLRSADEALAVVKQHGGNRVCLASVPSHFEPEFQVRPLPSRQHQAVGAQHGRREFSQNIS